MTRSDHVMATWAASDMTCNRTSGRKTGILYTTKKKKNIQWYFHRHRHVFGDATDVERCKVERKWWTQGRRAKFREVEETTRKSSNARFRFETSTAIRHSNINHRRTAYHTLSRCRITFMYWNHITDTSAVCSPMYNSSILSPDDVVYGTSLSVCCFATTLACNY